MAVTFILGALLEENNITRHSLAVALEGKLHRNTIYNVFSERDAVRMDLDTLGIIVQALSDMLGRPIRADEIVKVEIEPHELRGTAKERKARKRYVRFV